MKKRLHFLREVFNFTGGGEISSLRALEFGILILIKIYKYGAFPLATDTTTTACKCCLGTKTK